MIRAIIFDCFGVLIGKGFENTYQLAGGDPLKDSDFIKNMLGQANLGLISDKQFQQSMADKIDITLDEWNSAVKRAELPDTELLTYIKELRKSYKTAILSNANTGVLAKHLGDEWLQSCFDEVIASADTGLVKPDPRIYKLAANRLGVNTNECVFVDDRHFFLEVGKDLGMKVILFKNFLQLKQDLERLLI